MADNILGGVYWDKFLCIIESVYIYVGVHVEFYILQDFPC